MDNDARGIVQSFLFSLVIAAVAVFLYHATVVKPRIARLEKRLVVAQSVANQQQAQIAKLQDSIVTIADAQERTGQAVQGLAGANDALQDQVNNNARIANENNRVW